MRAISCCLLALPFLSVACASSASELRPEQWRQRLRGAMSEQVATREQRDRLSRVLADAVDADALSRLTRPDVQAAFGKGSACDGYDLCAQQGFAGSDWYYLIGTAADPKIEQLPVLIVGFDAHERVSRVYTLTTH